MSGGFPERDFDQEFSITLKWHQWNRILHLVDAGLKWKSHEEVGLNWAGTGEIKEDEEIIDALKGEYFETRPGNGMKDWPESMKEAYNESVRELMEDLE